ncbi:Complex III subunit 9 [Aphelenchoides bicaudatus]|nr:Complex III subunit 9 [Aphelenchoides bicaudatus]
MGIFGTFYRTVGKRFSTSLALAAGGVFVFDVAINRGGDYIWDSNNRGKQWKEIRPQILRLQQENAELAEKARLEEEAESKAEESEQPVNENEGATDSPNEEQ